MADLTPEEFAKKTLARADKLIRTVGLSLFSSVIRDTPVGDPDLWQSTWKDTKGRATTDFNPSLEGYVGGRLRGNWRCSVGEADTSTTGEHDFPTGGAVMRSTEQGCEQANRKKALYLSNSLPYAARIEYDGHSTQAPSGMVRKNAARIKTIIRTQLQLLKG